jgi:hypothetical protein
LDIAVRRRDRFFEASGVWLFIALMVGLLWPNVLVVFVGILNLRWLSLVPGLVGTALLVGWGTFLSRGAMTRARGTGPYVLVEADGLVVWNPAEPPTGAAVRIPRDYIDVVVVDQPAKRQRRADRVRFPVSADSDPSGSTPTGWLYCPDESTLLAIGLGLGGVPNLLVVAPGRRSWPSWWIPKPLARSSISGRCCGTSGLPTCRGRFEMGCCP